MAFGAHPFIHDGSNLYLQFQPVIPAYLLPASGVLTATFLSEIQVFYHTAGLAALIPGTYQIRNYQLLLKNGRTVTIASCRVPSHWAEKIRTAEVRKIDVYIERVP